MSQIRTSKRLAFASALALAFASRLASADEASEAEALRGLPIETVVVSGNRRIAAEDLTRDLPHLRPSAPFTPEGMAEDIRSLWSSGFLDDIQVDLSRRGDGVHLRLLIEERPLLMEIAFSGNKKISRDDLLKVIEGDLKVGSILNNLSASAAAQKLREKYAEEGYYLAEIAVEVLPKRDNQALVRFVIREHDSVSVQSIQFIGNAHMKADELRAAMLTGQREGIWSLLRFGPRGPYRDDVFLTRDIPVIQALYYDEGFLSVEIDEPRVALSPDRRGVVISIPIRERPRYRISKLRVYERADDGKEVEPLGGRRHLREMVEARAGDYFNRAALVKDIEAIRLLYRDAGYAYAEVTPETRLDPETENVDIDVVIRRAAPVRFGRIEIRGNTKTQDKVIRRELQMAEGEVFSETKMALSRARLGALGFFERVDIAVAESDSPAFLDVHVEVVEKPTGTFQVGAGFSSVDSFMLNAQIQQHNLFGRGQSLSLNGQISGTRKLVDFSFFEPYLFDTSVSMGLSLYNQMRSYEQFSTATTGGSLTFGYPLVNPELRASLTYTLQWDKISAGVAPLNLGTAEESSVFERLPLSNLIGNGRTSSVRATLTYDKRDNQLFPTAGTYFQGSVELAPSMLGSENQFARYRATGRMYYPLTDDNSLVLRWNGEAGLVTSPSAAGVPVFTRFFLGGVNDVRGFPLRSLGPRLPLRAALDENADPLPNGTNIGGNLMFFQNLELEFPILDAIGIRGVLFTDLGNAWNLESRYCRATPSAQAAETDPCFSLHSLLHMRASWGFGIRWRSPLGPLRFEWGFPFKRLPYEERSRFEFTVGTSF